MWVKPALSLESGLQPLPDPWQVVLGSCLWKPCQGYQLPELEVPMGPISVNPRDGTENVPSRKLSPYNEATWQHPTTQWDRQWVTSLGTPGQHQGSPAMRQSLLNVLTSNLQAIQGREEQVQQH